MGTRNLTVVFMDGEYRVAQYGQWDGYPEGQGVTVLSFLRDEMDECRFKGQLRNVRFGNKDVFDNLLSEFEASTDGFISFENYSRFKAAFPELHRDTGAKILKMIQDGNVGILKNDISFAADGLFCEWAYVVDFDKRTFEVYTGFHKEPLKKDDRFYFLREEEENGYSGVKLEHEWSIDNLPSNEEFISTFEKEESAQ